MGILSFDSRTVGIGRAQKSWFGANISGVIVAMRRTLLSCALRARDGLGALVPVGFGTISTAHAGDLSLTAAVSSYHDFNRQESSLLTTALAVLSVTVVAAILLIRPRVRSAASE